MVHLTLQKNYKLPPRHTVTNDLIFLNWRYKKDFSEIINSRPNVQDMLKKKKVSLQDKKNYANPL